MQDTKLCWQYLLVFRFFSLRSFVRTAKRALVHDSGTLSSTYFIVESIRVIGVEITTNAGDL